MKPNKPPSKWTPVEVVWADAWVDSDSHSSDEMVAKFEGCFRKTLGYYMGERVVTTPLFSCKYTFIAETDDRKSSMGTLNAERITAVPSGMVMELNPLKKNYLPEPAPAPAKSWGP